MDVIVAERRRHRQSARKYYTVSIVVPLDLYALINAQAVAEKKSVSSMLLNPVQEYLKEQGTVIEA